MNKKRMQLYFVGIGGTGMASAAGLMKTDGHTVVGSDAKLYPPMSTLLEDLDVRVYPHYSIKNISQNRDKLFVIGNSLSKTHSEVEYILKENLKYTSFPELLSKTILKDKSSLVVAGTHGKTTTSSLISYCLDQLGEKPSFLIGGIPKNFQKSFSLNKSDLFVIEGDEYDTAFFDKESKFLHYRPSYLVLNNIEFDHADIFDSIDTIYKTFEKLLNLLSTKRKIIANIDDKGVKHIIQKLGIYDQVFKVSCYGKSKDADLQLLSSKLTEEGVQEFCLNIKNYGKLHLRSKLLGTHNCANIIQCIGLLEVLKEYNAIKPFDYSELLQHIFNFQGVQKRFEFLGVKNGALCFNDFAHHPTAVKHTLLSVKQKYPNKRLVAIFEPRNASSRRNIFIKEYGEALGIADMILLTPVPFDGRISEDKRMNLSKLKAINPSKTFVFDSSHAMSSWLKNKSSAKDLLLFMSCGNFEGILESFIDSDVTGTSFVST